MVTHSRSQESYSPRQRLGCCMPCDDSAPEGQKHLPPDGNAFALSGRRLLCYPCSPRAVPWAGGSLPLSGALSSEWLLLMGIANGRLNATFGTHTLGWLFPLGIANVRAWYTRIANLAKQEFVKKYSNFEPKKQGVLVTKESLGRKNAIFLRFSVKRWLTDGYTDIDL